MITLVRERSQHLNFEDRCSIKVYIMMGFSLLKEQQWSLDSCVGYARRHRLFHEDQILRCADEMNALPRKVLGYNTIEELFDSIDSDMPYP